MPRIKLMRSTGRQRRGLQKLIQHLPKHIEMVEVGCYRGESTEMFLQHVKILHAVDIWTVPETEAMFDDALRNYKNMRKIKKPSTEAAKDFKAGSLGFVYIDADHTHKAVKEDIAAWLPKIKRGGMIGGHDYCFASYPGVIDAVLERFKSPDFIFEDSSWLVTDITRCSQ
jgi:predicted O-methyltransferase YrrM